MWLYADANQPRFLFLFPLNSFFMNSFLRPFNAPGFSSLLPCSVPGSWQLFRHSKLLVTVEGVVPPTDMGPTLTDLSKVRKQFAGM